MKKSDANERNALKAIMDDVLKPFAPEFKKVVEQDDGSILLYLYLTHAHTHAHTLFTCGTPIFYFPNNSNYPVESVYLAAHIRALFEHLSS